MSASNTNSTDVSLSDDKTERKSKEDSGSKDCLQTENVKVSIMPETENGKSTAESSQSPDILLSDQTTLRFSDVETESIEQDSSEGSSETFEDAQSPNEQAQFMNSFYEKLSVTCQNLESTVASLQKPQKIEEIVSCTSSHSDNVNNETTSQTIPEVIQQDGSGVNRPESLSLSRPVSVEEKNKIDLDNEISKQLRSLSIDSQVSTEKASDIATNEPEKQGAYYIEPSSLSPNLLQGTVMRKGDMIAFVADNLEEKIKLSSPRTHTDSTGSQGSRRSSVRSIASASSSTSFATSSGLSHSPSSLLQQSPDDIPPIDAQAVLELESHARRVADSLDLMMGNIRNNLHKMSAITIGCQDAYKRSVDITCDSVDTSIKTMYALMAKCEELSLSMGPVEQLAGQIREIKRILDLFELQLTDK